MAVLANVKVMPFKTWGVHSNKYFITDADCYLTMALIFVLIYAIRLTVWSVRKVRDK